MNEKRIYFPNLNGLRFIAAFAVIIHHIEQLKNIFSLDNLWNKEGILPNIIHAIGPQGVVLFFVLSGFLITYLLLAEEKKTNTIAIRKFYVRRVLRIWPLYLLIVIISLFVFPYISFFEWPSFNIETIHSNLAWKLILYLTFFANIVLMILGIIPYASQAWSVGTEEQFYLVWPLLIKYIKKNRAILLVTIIICYNLFFLFINSKHSDFLPFNYIIRAFWNGFAIDNMAIGGLFAYVLFNKHSILKFLINKTLFFIAIAFLFTLYIYPVFIPYLNHIKFPILYGIIILNLASNKSFNRLFENKILNYLGSISYGLYMFHPIAITIAIKIAIYFNTSSNYIIFPITLFISIAISSLSFKYFESYFLKYKNKFTIVLSGKS